MGTVLIWAFCILFYSAPCLPGCELYYTVHSSQHTNIPPHHQTETSETMSRATPPLFLLRFVTLILSSEQDLESPRRQDSRRVCEEWSRTISIRVVKVGRSTLKVGGAIPGIWTLESLKGIMLSSSHHHHSWLPNRNLMWPDVQKLLLPWATPHQGLCTPELWAEPSPSSCFLVSYFVAAMSKVTNSITETRVKHNLQ